jgi:hypothetical protein
MTAESFWLRYGSRTGMFSDFRKFANIAKEASHGRLSGMAFAIDRTAVFKEQ